YSRRGHLKFGERTNEPRELFDPFRCQPIAERSLSVSDRYGRFSRDEEDVGGEVNWWISSGSTDRSDLAELMPSAHWQ
ncbi:MAG: hypothetical protein MUC94_17260, partial [bacterium]|nr:hypothetical protein [bacterium]